MFFEQVQNFNTPQKQISPRVQNNFLEAAEAEFGDFASKHFIYVKEPYEITFIFMFVSIFNITK